MCSDIPLGATDQRDACCAAHSHKPHPATAATMIEGAEEEKRAEFFATIDRPDLDAESSLSVARSAPDYFYDSCTQRAEARVPVFTMDANGTTQARAGRL